MHETGAWWDFGDLCWKFFRGLDWVYNHVNPNICCIGIGFACLTWWLVWQSKYNKEAAKNGTYK